MGSRIRRRRHLSPGGPEETGGPEEREVPLLSLQGGPGDGDGQGRLLEGEVTSGTKGRRVDIGHRMSNTAVA